MDKKVKIKCPGATGTCVVTVDLNVQISAVSSNIELCPYVDGSQLSQFDCTANIGFTPGSNDYAGYHFVYTFKIPHGTHTVQARAYTGLAAGFMAFFSNVYSVYKK